MIILTTKGTQTSTYYYIYLFTYKKYNFNPNLRPKQKYLSTIVSTSYKISCCLFTYFIYTNKTQTLIFTSITCLKFPINNTIEGVFTDMHFYSTVMKYENNMLLQRILKIQSKNKTTFCYGNKTHYLRFPRNRIIRK